ncbi:MAG: prenyltransferase [Chloroflexia bacterium]|nr:prenyltransferase [Chloroflexia bacterium]
MMPTATSATTAAVPPRWRIWFRAIRFFSFTTSTVPVLAASALARHEARIDGIALALMLIASMATHAGCNLANDLYDDRSSVDRVQVVGQGGVLQVGWLSRRDLAIGIAVSFLIAMIAALPIMIEFGLPIIVLALVSAAAAFFYTGGPFPLAYWALGEITVFLAMGVGMVGGVYYVHTGELPVSALLLGGAIGSLAAAILHANNLRDRDVDRQHRKRTLANLMNRRFGVLEYQALLIVPWLAVAGLILRDPRSWPLLIVVGALPRTIDLIRRVGATHATDGLNRILRQSAGLHMQFGLLVAVGYVTATMLDAVS